MNRGRKIVAAVGLVLVLGGFAWAVTGLPAFGHYHHAYGRIVAQKSVPERAATNSVVVTAFDYRAFDTLGEEFILFIAVVGVLVLLRTLREESEEREDPQLEGSGSTSTRWLGPALVAPLALLGGYIVTHGQQTPGGGFQGGVIVFAAVAYAFLGGRYRIATRLAQLKDPIEAVEALGAAGFVMIGLGGLIGVGTFFANFIPVGQSGLLTGGMIPLANISVGAEVAGALVMVLAGLLHQRVLTEP